MNLTGIRQQVFLDRYAKKDEAGAPLEQTPEEMWRRVAHAVAEVEPKAKRDLWEEKFYTAMQDFVFVPGGRILSGAGTGYKVTYYNCFVIPSPQDSRGGILKTLGQMVEIMSRGGGVGINLSSLRQRGSRVSKVNGFSSGPCNWAELFSVATKDIIQQGGCFATGTRIMTHRGLIPIEEIVFDNGRYFAATHKGLKEVTARFDNGVKDVYEVTAASGLSVAVTGEHKMLTFDKNGEFYQKPLRDFRVGEHVVLLLGEWRDDVPFVPLSTTIPKPSKFSNGRKNIVLPTEFTEDLAFLVGVYHADGSKIADEYSPIGKGIRIAMAKDRPEDLKTLLRVIARCFAIEHKLHHGDGAVWDVEIFSRALNEYLANNKLMKTSSVTVAVPEQVFRSPKSVVAAYIAGVFMGDGTNRGGKGGLRITTVSRQFAQELQLLLINLGIPSKINVQERQKQGWRTLYTVTVNGAVFMKRFARILAPWTEKVNDHPVSVRDGAFGWPFNVVNRFAYLANFQRTMARTNPTTSQKATLFLQEHVQSIHETDLPDVELLASCVPDTITAITPKGVASVYDLEVADTHLLSGNGFYTSNSRRGALMLMLWDWHPDIEEFITVKQDLARINGANLSVCVSDTFMDAVKNDSDWDLVFPDTKDPDYDTKWDGYLPNWIALGKKPIVHKTVKARKIWDLVAEAAWKSAEPGVVFMERYNKRFNNYYWEYINCVNPCVTGDTMVTTASGEIAARDLVVGDTILTPKGFKTIDKVYNNGKQRIYQVNFSDGGHLRATADHQLRVVGSDGGEEWKKIIEITPGDSVRKLVFLGAADHCGERNEGNRDEQEQHDNHHQILGIEGSDVHNYNFAFLADTKLKYQQAILTAVPQSIADTEPVSTPVRMGGSTASANTTWPMSAVISESFLSSQRVSKGNFIAEETKTHHMMTSTRMIEEIVIDGKRIGSSKTCVASILDTGSFEDVYDVHEPETLTWVTNGYVSLDCGEEGLPNWGVCNLCSINLAALVGENGEMDYVRLADVAKTIVRFQDDVVDADFYVFDEIKDRQLKGERRIGLGTMGLGDALIKMKLRYGSEVCLSVIDKMYKIIRDAAYDASVDIAKEKGPFPKIDVKKHLDGYFIKELPDEIRKKMKKHGVRNSVILQQAPTGTTSLLAGVSSGIEPVYEFEFIRRDRMGEHIIRHPLYDAWVEQFKKTNGREPTKEDRPSYFVSANDLTPEDHVYVQAGIQKYVDASISKTVNAPRGHTIEDVKRLYTLAYELGCKGIAYMREGSRLGVLTRKEDTKQDEVKVGTQYVPEVKPRPMVVNGSTYQVETPVGQAYITINTNGGKQPVELFVNVGKAGSDVTAMAEALGRLASLMLRIASPLTPMDRIHKIAAELIGIGGARSLGFGENRVRSLPDAVAKVIDRHFGFFGKSNGVHTANRINSHTETTPQQLPNVEPAEKPFTVPTQQMVSVEKRMVTVDLCPSCGEGSLVFEESCKKCYSCGYSEC